MIFLGNFFRKVLFIMEHSVAVDIHQAAVAVERVHHIVNESIPLPRDEPLADAFEIPIGTSAGHIFVPRAPRPVVGLAPPQPPLVPPVGHYSYSVPTPGSSGPISFDPRFPPSTRGVERQ